jgi:hypothetical protein
MAPSAQRAKQAAQEELAEKDSEKRRKERVCGKVNKEADRKTIMAWFQRSDPHAAANTADQVAEHVAQDETIQQQCAATGHRRDGAAAAPFRVRALGACSLLAFGLAAVLLALLPTAPATAAATTTFKAAFHGTFELTFGSGPGGTDELHFRGIGDGRAIGRSTIEGYARLRPIADRPGCSQIISDKVTITTADRSTLAVVNDAVDCTEMTSDGRTLIHGSGTSKITGGTKCFDEASGYGRVSTEAVVTGSVPGGVSGTFDPLAFVGSISPK